MAIACFGFVTLRPEPLFSFPFLNAFISRSTLCDAFGPYLLWLAFLLDFLLAVFFAEEDLLELVDFFELLDFLELPDFFVAIAFSL